MSPQTKFDNIKHLVLIGNLTMRLKEKYMFINKFSFQYIIIKVVSNWYLLETFSKQQVNMSKQNRHWILFFDKYNCSHFISHRNNLKGFIYKTFLFIHILINISNYNFISGSFRYIGKKVHDYSSFKTLGLGILCWKISHRLYLLVGNKDYNSSEKIFIS